MSFSLIVMWYQDGARISMSAARVLDAIGGTVSERLGSHAVRYPGGEEFWLSFEREPEGAIRSVGIDRPFLRATWDVAVRLLNLGNGCCTWPGDAYAVASLAAATHLPADVVTGMGLPQVVDDGASLAELVANSR